MYIVKGKIPSERTAVLKKNKAELEISDLEALFNEYYQDMLAVAFKYLHSLADAEDAVSKAFVSLAANPGMLKGLDPDQIRPRLLSLAKFRAFDHYRRESGHDHAELTGDEQQEPKADDVESLELALLLQQMKEPQKTVFSLRYAHDLKISEIAKLLGISSAAVRKHLRDGKAWLRSAITGEDEDV